ncbi:MAG: hypothetical protein ABUL72_06735, partial [Armatimonadota bacterium]
VNVAGYVASLSGAVVPAATVVITALVAAIRLAWSKHVGHGVCGVGDSRPGLGAETIRMRGSTGAPAAGKAILGDYGD